MYSFKFKIFFKDESTITKCVNLDSIDFNLAWLKLQETICDMISVKQINFIQMQKV